MKNIIKILFFAIIAIYKTNMHGKKPFSIANFILKGLKKQPISNIQKFTPQKNKQISNMVNTIVNDRRVLEAVEIKEVKKTPTLYNNRILCNIDRYMFFKRYGSENDRRRCEEHKKKTRLNQIKNNFKKKDDNHPIRNFINW